MSTLRQPAPPVNPEAPARWLRGCASWYCSPQVETFDGEVDALIASLLHRLAATFEAYRADSVQALLAAFAEVGPPPWLRDLDAARVCARRTRPSALADALDGSALDLVALGADHPTDRAYHLYRLAAAVLVREADAAERHHAANVADLAHRRRMARQAAAHRRALAAFERLMAQDAARDAELDAARALGMA